MPPAHPSGIPHSWPGSLLCKRPLKAQFGAVLSGDKPTCFPSLALCCTLQVDKGQLSSAGIPARLQGQRGRHPRSPKYLHLCREANCTCRMPPPSGCSHSPSARAADTAGHLACRRRRAKSRRRGCHVSTRGRAVFVDSSLPPRSGALSPAGAGEGGSGREASRKDARYPIFLLPAAQRLPCHRECVLACEVVHTHVRDVLTHCHTDTLTHRPGAEMLSWLWLCH